MDQPRVYDEDSHAFVHGAAVADLSGGLYGATAEAAINAILAALRSAGILAED